MDKSILVENKYELINTKADLNHQWITKDDFKETLHFLRSKEDKYLTKIVKNLNTLHNTKFSDAFWRKSFGLGFRRMIHITYDAYRQHKDNFNPSLVNFNKVRKTDYVHILDFENFRDHFTNTDLGYSQLFSQYIDCFHEDIVDPKIKKDTSTIEIEEINELIEIKRNSTGKGNKLWSRTLKKVKRVTLNGLLYKLSLVLFKNVNPEIVIIGSYFKLSYLIQLIYKSKGRIKDINLPPNKVSSKFDKDLRTLFFDLPTDYEDQFDKFFYHSLFYNFPSFFLEDFDRQFLYYSDYVERFKNFNYIISENWISNTHNSFYLALAKETKNIKHIYNEHNAMFHHIEGGSVNLQTSLTDIYYTIGWSGNGVKKGASLYNFNHKKKYKKKFDILYVSSNTFIKRSEWNAHYAFSQDAAQLHIRFVHDFFNSLSINTLKKIVYRGYPKREKWNTFNKEEVLMKFTNKVSFVDDFRHSSKVMMRKSQLVVIDYISTGYLEALVMNIPFIVFWDKNTYFLNDQYSNFFDDLIDCGVCQTSPEDAANFVNELEDVNYWWYSKKVQEARLNFLKTNIGDPKDAIKFYLNLLKQ